MLLGRRVGTYVIFSDSSALVGGTSLLPLSKRYTPRTRTPKRSLQPFRTRSPLGQDDCPEPVSLSSKNRPVPKDSGLGRATRGSGSRKLAPRASRVCALKGGEKSHDGGYAAVRPLKARRSAPEYDASRWPSARYASACPPFDAADEIAYGQRTETCKGRPFCGAPAEGRYPRSGVPARPRARGGKPVRPADQIRAAELLLAYGWGKPAAFSPIGGADPLEHDEVAAEIRSIAEALEKRPRLGHCPRSDCLRCR